jgi:MarR family transcriptional regulator, 2-MHQ and catechol-resistance regulon repressor
MNTSPKSSVRNGTQESIQIRCFRELLRTYGLMERAMQPYFARHGISGSQWGVLRNLLRAEQEGLAGLRITALSARLLIRPPSVTGVVDRLERAGLVVRQNDPADQRAKFVQLTLAGRRLVEHVLIGHPRQVEAVLGGLSKAEQASLHELLLRLGRHLDKEVNRNGVPARTS